MLTIASQHSAAITLETTAMLTSLAAELGSDKEQTRLEAIHWLNTLLHAAQPQVGWGWWGGGDG